VEISQEHKIRKGQSYWTNLVQGETGHYKAEAIDRLVSEVALPRHGEILDIGCGTSAIATALREQLEAERLVFMDYDAAVIEAMRRDNQDPAIEAIVGDIFTVGTWGRRFALVLLLDMLHEVYSFYGRPVREVTSQIDHRLGQKVVRDALAQVAKLVVPGGGVIISDNLLCPEDVAVTVRVRHAGAEQAVRRFLAEYPSRRMAATWLGADVFRLGAHDLCILLTQYNKIKSGQEDRWNVEKYEIHQYMTLAQFDSTFTELGFALTSVVGTPDGARAEWEADFQVLDGLSTLPDKRITLLAVKAPATP
jgi:SAM-dependent methyltransferase